MTDFQTVAKTVEIAPGAMMLIDLDGVEVVIANVDGAFFAFGNTCTHVGGPLVEGDLKGETVTCPWHFTVFDVKSGQPLEGPGAAPVPTYVVRVEGDNIQVANPDPP
jgi:nitrite reductase/ring-hydroxylating ferredoxin subunit